MTLSTKEKVTGGSSVYLALTNAFIEASLMEVEQHYCHFLLRQLLTMLALLLAI